MQANKGRTAVWILDTRKHNAQPLRLTDLSANSDSPQWSADGNTMYFLSSRSGSSQVWRRAITLQGETLRADSEQVTHLPLDVGSFRVSPRGDRVVVSVEVFGDCPDLACTTQRLEAATKSSSHGVLYDKLFVRHWDAWSDGRRSQLFALSLDATGLANGTPLNLSGSVEGDVPSKPFGGARTTPSVRDGQTVAFAVRAGAAGEPWSTNFDIYRVDVSGGLPQNLTGENPAWDGQPAFSRTARNSPTSPWIVRASRPIASTWCCST